VRKLFINTTDGMYLENINPERNFYFFELENMISKAKETDQSIKRNFTICFEGEIVCDEMYVIDDMLQKNLKKEMKKNNPESVEYLNNIQENIYFTTEFKEFLIKYDEKLGNRNKQPFSFILDIHKLKNMFDYVHESTGKHIFLELNNIMNIIEELYFYLIKEMDLNKEKFYEFLSNETNLKKVCEYIPTKLKSINVNRLNAIYPAVKEYHELQDTLFKMLPFYIPFKECMNIQDRLIEDIYNDFYSQMFERKIIKSEEMLIQEVILPIVNEYQTNITDTLKTFERKGG